MSKKSKGDRSGYVFSTDPGFKFEFEPNQEAETLPAAAQKLKISIDRKQRGGKTVSLVTGFVGTAADLEELGKKLKNHCGTGGSAKDNEILVQGDQREKILQWLLKSGYKQARLI